LAIQKSMFIFYISTVCYVHGNNQQAVLKCCDQVYYIDIATDNVPFESCGYQFQWKQVLLFQTLPNHNQISSFVQTNDTYKPS